MTAKRDDNRIPALQGVSNADGVTPIDIYVDPITHRLLVEVTGVIDDSPPSLQTISDYNYISDVVTNYPYHTVVISKEGYETVRKEFVMNNEKEETITLKPAVKFMYDSSNNIYVKSNKENDTSLKRNRINKV